MAALGLEVDPCPIPELVMGIGLPWIIDALRVKIRECLDDCTTLFPHLVAAIGTAP